MNFELNDGHSSDNEQQDDIFVTDLIHEQAEVLRSIFSFGNPTSDEDDDL